MNQNDITKGHANNQNDISNKSHILYGLFVNPLEKTLFVSVKKIEKIVAAIYLVTDVMDKSLALTESLRKDSLELLTTAYGLLTSKEGVSRGSLTRVSIRLDQVISLVHIGSISHHISQMNADIIVNELTKLVDIFSDEASKLATQEQAFIVSSVPMSQPLISGDIMRDTAFDEVVARYQSKRHQNDIKTTLLHQNDISKDISKIKTTFQKDTIKSPLKISDKLDRKQEILNVIKSKGVCTLADIKSMVTDCSDKTLQREVNTLVEMNVVRKEGNKRWTTYQISKN